MLAAVALALPAAAMADDGTSVTHDPDTSLDRAPVTTAFPTYPSIARRDRLQGEATVCFTINARGRVVRPAIRSSSHKIFERPALRAIRNSSFEPLAKGEDASPVKTCRTYRFRLEPLTAQS